MSTKRRISASVDAELVDAGHRAVNTGQAEHFSAWVNEALQRQVTHDRRLQALDEFLAAYEAEHGAITDDEIRETTRGVRARAVVVRRQPNAGQLDRDGRGAA